MKKKIACLITGVPRGHKRCLPSLKFLLGDCDVDYFAILREEFATAETIGELRDLIPDLRIVVVPQDEVDRAISQIDNTLIKPTVSQMWFEVLFGFRGINENIRYDFVFRTRFDIWFVPQFIPEVSPEANSVWIPEQLSWSGSNDIICLASPVDFEKYASTFFNIQSLSKRGIRIPEHLLSTSLDLLGVKEVGLSVHFVLYREALHQVISDVQLNILALNHPELSAYALGSPTDTPQSRENSLQHIRSITEIESLFPTYGIPLVNARYRPEIDKRDMTPFRFLELHFHMRRALKNVSGITFKIHYMPKGWSVDKLRVMIDNHPITMRVSATDEFGRLVVFGDVAPTFRFRRPWSKIGISAGGAIIPSQVNPSSNDHRRISIAISEPMFIVA